MNEDRLRAGARILGELWESGARCERGWMPTCACRHPSKFCVAKQQWTALALQSGRKVKPDEYLVEAMTGSELDETKLTIVLENGLRIGPAGMIPTREASKMVGDPDAVPAVLQVLKSFPGARVVQGFK